MYDPDVFLSQPSDQQNLEYWAVNTLVRMCRPEKVKIIDHLDSIALQKMMKAIDCGNKAVIDAVGSVDRNGKFILSKEKFIDVFDLFVDVLRRRWMNSHDLNVDALFEKQEKPS